MSLKDKGNIITGMKNKVAKTTHYLAVTSSSVSILGTDEFGKINSTLLSSASTDWNTTITKLNYILKIDTINELVTLYVQVDGSLSQLYSASAPLVVTNAYKGFHDAATNTVRFVYGTSNEVVTLEVNTRTNVVTQIGFSPRPGGNSIYSGSVFTDINTVYAVAGSSTYGILYKFDFTDLNAITVTQIGTNNADLAAVVSIHSYGNTLYAVGRLATSGYSVSAVGFSPIDALTTSRPYLQTSIYVTHTSFFMSDDGLFLYCVYEDTNNVVYGIKAFAINETTEELTSVYTSSIGGNSYVGNDDIVSTAGNYVYCKDVSAISQSEYASTNNSVPAYVELSPIIPDSAFLYPLKN